jgi:hypothetical protein
LWRTVVVPEQYALNRFGTKNDGASNTADQNPEAYSGTLRPRRPTMNIAELHTGEVSRSASGAITGTLYLKLGEDCFPDVNWSDFVVVVLEWWCSALERLHRGEPGPLRVPFMDGPFRADLEALTDGRLAVTLVTWQRSEDEEVHHAAVDRDHLTHSVVVAARATLHLCRQRGWASRDIEALRDSLEALSGCTTFGSA